MVQTQLSGGKGPNTAYRSLREHWPPGAQADGPATFRERPSMAKWKWAATTDPEALWATPFTAHTHRFTQ